MTTGSSKSVAALVSEVNTTWPDNTTGLVTPAVARQTLLDMIASTGNIADFSIRIRLTANQTFYVTTTGVNSAAGGTLATPWATIQYAYDFIADNYDLNGHVATIQAGNGTYTTGLVTSKGIVGANGPGSVLIIGNADHVSCVISTTSNDCFGIGETAFGAGISGTTQITIGGFKLTTAVAGNAVNVSGGGCSVVVGTPGFSIEFGVCAQDHMVANHGAFVIAGTNNFVSGGALIHAAAISNGVIALHLTTETLSGTPAFTYYAYTETNGSLYLDVMTFAGTGATGVRYFANGGVIYALGGATYLPGNSAGTTLFPGAYIGANGYAPVQIPAGVVAQAPLNITVGVAPTVPVDGDMWYESGALKFRLGGSTKTFTLS